MEQPRPRSRGSTAPASSSTHKPEVVIGIDPSLRGTGFGVIHIEHPHPRALVFDTIKCPAKWPKSRCLVKTADTLKRVIHEYKPTVCVIEAIFYAQNKQTALLMGEARGVCLLAAAEAGLDIYEFSPRKVKRAVVGYGAAQKQAVAKMVRELLCLDKVPAADAADALALAIAFAGQLKTSMPDISNQTRI